MQEKNQISNLPFEKKVQLIITLGTVASLIASTFLAVKLSPLYQALAVTVERVDAVEERVASSPSGAEFKMLCGQVATISGKVDHVLEILVNFGR